MAQILSLLHYFLSFAIVLSVIVFVHEFGHYFVAKLSGVKASDFAIGFGKTLFSLKDKHGTNWKICAIPLGGYVKFLGDSDPASLSASHETIKPSEHKYMFNNKPLIIKAAIVAAGPLFNFLFSIIIFTCFLYNNGTFTTSNVVSKVLETGTAYKAGIIAGDQIIAIDGTKVEHLLQVERIVSTHPSIALQFTIKRNSKEHLLTVTPMPEFIEHNGRKIKIGKIGVIGEQIKQQKLSLLESVKHSVNETFEICNLTLKALKQMIFGQRTYDDIEGPIGIAKIAGESTKKGLSFTLWIMAMLSINLGLLNLLPIPVLDGGHLMFYVIETIAGKRVVVYIQRIAMVIGLSIIIGLSAFAIINDIIKLKLF